MRVKPISGFYIDLKKSEKYSKVEECNMSTNCVGTYEQYKERLLKMKPNVYLHGKKLDRSNGKEGAERDLADWIVGGTYVMKQCYDTANDPRYADVCTVTSHLTGNTINRSPISTTPRRTC